MHYRCVIIHLVIQGAADIGDNITQTELSKTLDFCAYAFEPTSPEDRANVLKKALTASSNILEPTADRQYEEKTALFHANLNVEEKRIAKRILARKMMKMDNYMGIDSFDTDVINGLAPKIERGNLGLVSSA